MPLCTVSRTAATFTPRASIWRCMSQPPPSATSTSLVLVTLGGVCGTQLQVRERETERERGGGGREREATKHTQLLREGGGRAPTDLG